MSEGLIGQFRLDGFAVVQRLLPRDLIDAHVAACDRLLSAHGLTVRAHGNSDPNLPLFKALVGVGVDNPEFQSLHLHPKLRQHVAGLLDDDDPILTGSTTNIWEKGREPHADTLMLYRDPPEKVCRTWCALEDIDPEAGAFYVVPGTHRSVRTELYEDVLSAHPEILDVLRAYNAKVQPEWRDNRFIWDKLCKATAARVAGMSRQSFAVSKGDVVFFDPGVIHGTMAATNSALTRKAIIAEWHGRAVRSYAASAYFGPRLDRRMTDNGKPTFDEAIRCPLGLYVPSRTAA